MRLFYDNCFLLIENYLKNGYDVVFNYIIKKETLALDIIKKELDTEEVNLNGVNVKFDVERVSK